GGGGGGGSRGRGRGCGRAGSGGRGSHGDPEGGAEAARHSVSRRSHAGENQGGRPRKSLPATQATTRAGVRTDQTGTRIPSVSAARLREGAGRVGNRLHRPQPS